MRAWNRLPEGLANATSLVWDEAISRGWDFLRENRAIELESGIYESGSTLEVGRGEGRRWKPVGNAGKVLFGNHLRALATARINNGYVLISAGVYRGGNSEEQSNLRLLGLDKFQ